MKKDFLFLFSKKNDSFIFMQFLKILHVQMNDSFETIAFKMRLSKLQKRYLIYRSHIREETNQSNIS
jgi:hypothetical protein